jgi:hypothetical protein
MVLTRLPSQGKILFVCGSINQTTQLHQIAQHLPEYSHAYTPYFCDGYLELVRRLGLLENSIAGAKLRARCVNHLHDHGLMLDERGAADDYDLVVTASDVIVPRVLRKRKVLLVQEGILDPEGRWYRARQLLPFLPRWTAGTAWTGTSGLFDVACLASEGYRQHLVARGVPPHRLVVTGIPNFDDCERFRNNRFPRRGYVLACTSDGRETFKRDDRPAFLRKLKAIAAGRPVIVKLHPNEKVERATAEIAAVLPDALVFTSGSAEEMIANCDVLVTEWSSTAFVGMALGKEVHSNYSSEELRRLLPVQNGGASARAIADVCRKLLEGTQGHVVALPRRPRAELAAGRAAP